MAATPLPTAIDPQITLAWRYSFGRAICRAPHRVHPPLRASAPKAPLRTPCGCQIAVASEFPCAVGAAHPRYRGTAMIELHYWPREATIRTNSERLVKAPVSASEGVCRWRGAVQFVLERFPIAAERRRSHYQAVQGIHAGRGQSHQGSLIHTATRKVFANMLLLSGQQRLHPYPDLL